MRFAKQLAIGSIVISLIVLGLKYAAYRLTGSAALYSDAVESIINVATAVAAFFAVRLSAAPPDANHPYGHSKAEYLSAVLEGVLIVLAAIAILREAYEAYQNLRPIQAAAEGLGVNAVASVINGLWCLVLFRYGRRIDSPALLADARHLFSDVITSAGVLVGVGLVALTGWQVLDPAIAALVAVNILVMGWGLMRRSIGGLMDEAAPEPMQTRIRDAISQNAEGAIEAHDLKTRKAGRTTFVEFHLVVPGAMTVEESHAICDRIEAALRAEIEGVRISIHVEPEEKAKHPGGVPVM